MVTGDGAVGKVRIQEYSGSGTISNDAPDMSPYLLRHECLSRRIYTNSV